MNVIRIGKILSFFHPSSFILHPSLSPSSFIRRRYITFIEIMIIITILVLSLGLIGVNIRSLIKEQRFRSEVGLVVDQLRLAQDLMVVLNADALMKFNIVPTEVGIRYWIELETNLSAGWKRELMRPRPNLYTIKIVEFNDTISGTKYSNNVELHFLSGGSVMSQGVLRLATENGEMERFVCLPGYPRPIVSILDQNSDPGCNPSNEANFAEKLTFYTQREIEDRVQSNAPAPQQ